MCPITMFVYLMPQWSQHVLVKCSNYEDKFDLLKLSRRALSDQPIFLVDDLTKNDLHERKKWSARVKQLYSAGVKLKFYNGKWRGEGGRPYTFAWSLPLNQL